MNTKPNEAEVFATTIPGGPFDGWYCRNHPDGEYLANATTREQCWGCGAQRETSKASPEQVASMQPVTVMVSR